MSGPVVTEVIRLRTSADVPALVRVLAEQQPRTGYPFRWPLPYPVEQFVVRGYEERAWVAEVDGAVVGHVIVGSVEEDLMEQFGAATGATALAMVSVLFVATSTRGTGVGGRLLDTAVTWARGQGRTPVLDVLPTHDVALAVYRHRGWTEVARVRPAWLPDEAPSVVLMALLPG